MDNHGINVPACLHAVAKLKVDLPGLWLVCNVSANTIATGRGDQGERCETALTLLLGAADALTGMADDPVLTTFENRVLRERLATSAERIRQCRQEIKALVPGRLRQATTPGDNPSF